jgi:hypothetical protein
MIVMRVVDFVEEVLRMTVDLVEEVNTSGIKDFA